MQSNQAKFNFLRDAFVSFCFQNYEYFVEKDVFFAKFDFILKKKNEEIVEFHPSFEIPARDFYHWDEVPKPVLDNLVFHIGMIELVSYWKIACPKVVIIKPFALEKEQILWWKKLYFNGLGEFFYVNGIETDFDGFMKIENDVSARKIETPSVSEEFFDERTLIPVGGGKDSVVTLELLRKQMTVKPLIINPRGATKECVAVAGFNENAVVEVRRTLDPVMLKMNAEGYLNGHTPFSALLAFYTVLLGFATKSKYIALSNESSANEPTVPDTEINHQYSKSVAFENDFRQYVAQYINPDIQYFSFLRPLNELQIAKLFSKEKQYRKAFKSCNVGSKTDTWCGRCPKCLFTWIALSPFITRAELIEIFGKDLLKDNELRPVLKQLDGRAEVKPFECVGTVGEVRACINEFLCHNENNSGTIVDDVSFPSGTTVEDYLRQFDNNNNLPALFEKILKEAVHD